jgi:hypothetical protein
MLFFEQLGNWGVIVMILIVALLLINIWNGHSLDQIKKQIKRYEITTPDSRYFELLNKIRYITYVGVLIFVIIGFLGYNTLAGLEVKMTEATLEKTEQLDSLRKRYKKHVTRQEDAIKEDINRFNQLTSKANKVYKNLKQMQEFSEIKTYSAVGNIKLDISKNKLHKIAFEEIGIKKVNSKPIVFIEPNGNFRINTVKVTKESATIEIIDTTSELVSIDMLVILK